MILVDTSVWIDHLRRPDARLQELLETDEVATHPYVRLELALGSIVDRKELLANMAKLPQAPVAADHELFRLVEMRKLYRRGVGVTDLHLLAAALLDGSMQIWTRDRQLRNVADELAIGARFS